MDPAGALSRAAIDVLARSDWLVVEAADSDAALAACLEHDADVLIAGGDDCLQILDAVKHHGELFGVSVILMGTALDVEQVREALARGAEDVLRTPIDPVDLLARAHSAARTKALVTELTAQNRRLEELLLFDELTGLRNRRALLNELEMLLAAARRHGRPISILMLDLDSFKPINDRYGHAVGDEVLCEFGRRLAGRLRTEDVAGRIGGDELLVALPDTDVDGAAVVAGSICRAIRGEPFHTSAGLVRITASIGSATWHGEELGALLEAADQALYRAKADGRDRVF